MFLVSVLGRVDRHAGAQYSLAGPTKPTGVSLTPGCAGLPQHVALIMNGAVLSNAGRSIGFAPIHGRPTRFHHKDTHISSSRSRVWGAHIHERLVAKLKRV